MEIEQRYSDKDKEQIDAIQKIIEHHNELLIREILKNSPDGEWNQECESIFRNDRIRDYLYKKLYQVYSVAVPVIIFKP